MASFLLELERNISPQGPHDQYTGYVATMDGSLDITAQGETPGEVRRKLAYEIARRLRAGSFTATFPPRAWNEVIDVELSEEENQRLKYD